MTFLAKKCSARTAFKTLAATVLKIEGRSVVVYADADLEVALGDDDGAWLGQVASWRAGAEDRHAQQVSDVAEQACMRASGIGALRSRQQRLLPNGQPAVVDDRVLRKSLDGPNTVAVTAGLTKLRGLDQLYELLDLEANVDGVAGSPSAAHVVAAALRPHSYEAEVCAAAALVCWKMVERSPELALALVGLGAAHKCVSVLQHFALQSADLERGRSNAKKAVEHRLRWTRGLAEGASANRPDGEPHLFCTQTDLSRPDAIIGCLDALARKSVAARRIVDASATPWLLRVASSGAAASRVQTAAALCSTLARSTDARNAFLRGAGNAAELVSLLDSDQPNLNLAGAACFASLVRDTRCLLDPGDCVAAFVGLLRLIEQCLTDAERPQSADGPVDDDEAPEDDETPNALLEQATLALWGVVVSLHERSPRELDRLYDPGVALWGAAPDDGAAKKKKGAPKPLFVPAGPPAGPGLAPWPATLIRVCRLGEGCAPDAAACALACCFGGSRGSAAAAECAARSVPTLFDDVCCLVEASPSTRVRVHAALALGHFSKKPSAALDALFDGGKLLDDFVLQREPPEKAPSRGSLDSRASRLSRSSRGSRASLASSRASMASRGSIGDAPGRPCAVRAALEAMALAGPQKPLFTFGRCGGDVRLVRVLDGGPKSHRLDEALATVLLNLALYARGGRRRSGNVLRAHVNLVDCGAAAAAGVPRGALGAALARGVENRARLHQLGVAAALASTLGGGADLSTKEAAVAALWLLAQDADGAARVALAEPRRAGADAAGPEQAPTDGTADGASSQKSESAAPSGGDVEAVLSSTSCLALLVGLACFDSNVPGYTPIRTLAIGALESVARQSDDLLRVVAAFAEVFTPTLLDAARTPFPWHESPAAGPSSDALRRDLIRARGCSRPLQYAAVDLAFLLAACPDGAKALGATPGGSALVSVCEMLVKSSDSRLRTIGAFRAAKLACDASHRHPLDHMDALEHLAKNIADELAPPELHVYSLHALLNLSGDRGLQPKLCRLALAPLLRAARRADDIAAFDDAGLRLQAAPAVISKDLHLTVNLPHANSHADSHLPQHAAAPPPVSAGDGGALFGDVQRGDATVFTVEDFFAGVETADRDYDLEARYAQSILANLSRNVVCREQMYAMQLKDVSRGVRASKHAHNPSLAAANGVLSAGPTKKLRAQSISDDRSLQEFFTTTGALADVRARRNAAVAATSVAAPPQKELCRLRRRFCDPIAALWEEAPDLDALSQSLSQSTFGTFGSLSQASLRAAGEELKRNVSSSTLLSGASVSGLISLAAPTPRLCADETLALVRPPARDPKAVRTAASLRAWSHPRSPLRSSHRVGPTAGPAPSALPEGEDRWGPRVLAYWRAADALPFGAPRRFVRGRVRGAFIAARAAARAVRGVHARHVQRADKGQHLAAADEAAAAADAEALPWNKSAAFESPQVKLVKFHHSPGATVYASLFPLYSLKLPGPETAAAGDDSGEERRKESEECFFYYTTSVVCEAVDPGPGRRHTNPDRLDLILQDVPQVPPHVVPQRLTRPEAPAFLAAAPPPVKHHALVQCLGEYGVLPPEPLPMHIRAAPPVFSKAVARRVSGWSLDESVFAPRHLRDGVCDAQDYFETARSVERALNVDWDRLVSEEDRFVRFVAQLDEGVVLQEQTVEDELLEAKSSFLKRYRQCLWLFDYYCACSSTTSKQAFSMQENAYLRFVSDCKVTEKAATEKALSAQDCGKIFIICNQESDKTSALASLNEDKALMRFEFIECLTRLALGRFGARCKDVSDCLDMLWDLVILPNAPAEAIYDPESFKRDRLYTEDVDKVLRSHLRTLQIVFRKYAHLDPEQGRAKFGLKEYIAVLHDARLIGENLTMREARLAYWWSKMLVVDEVKHRKRFIELDFLEFVEALCRCADMMSLPTDEDVADLKARNMLEYEHKLQYEHSEHHVRLRKRRPSAEFNQPKTRPLHDKADKLICLLLGRLALVFKGSISQDGRRAALIGTYITPQQYLEMGGEPA
eukprot:CAMPEP_0184096594 /NCGR_PEP_ID=MMETSP0974-20121125/10366_1 /TAXON_ID=483370 /ORGANISM="non described non described, Strain CCMP2097" /LENGTH=2022 /DNA_ID=CAMNT_0026399433 /DNA_START=181 /DNA_END=6248 /DNA_ORIENTATION=+